MGEEETRPAPVRETGQQCTEGERERERRLIISLLIRDGSEKRATTLALNLQAFGSSKTTKTLSEGL